VLKRERKKRGKERERPTQIHIYMVTRVPSMASIIHIIEVNTEHHPHGGWDISG
jgi:predicted transcriptional regulator